jgi:uncharacterized phage protein gp47/JayE
MAFNRPTLAAIVTRVETDFVTRLQITSTQLRRALARVLARVWAGAVHALHGHIEWAAKQIFASTADDEYLDQHGAEVAVARKAATYATGNVTFTGINGSTIAIGTRVQRSDGVKYETTASGTIASGTATVAVTAQSTGVAGNADAGVALSLVSAIAGINSGATVAAGDIDGGVDTESNDDYRARILARKRNPPQGGSVADYERWALEVAGVTRVWVYPGYLGLGKVGVTFVLDDEVDIIPDSTKVSEVQAYLDDVTRRPVTAEVNVFAPVEVTLNFTISVTPNTAAVKAQVEAELRDLLLREGAPGVTLLLSHIREAISTAVGENDHTLTVPSANVTHTVTQMPVFGSITWV